MANAVTRSWESRMRSSNLVTKLGSPPRWNVNATAVDVDEPWLTYVEGAPAAAAGEVAGAALVGATTVELVVVVVVVVVVVAVAVVSGSASAFVVVVGASADGSPLQPSSTASTDAAAAPRNTVRRSSRTFIGSCPCDRVSTDPVGGTR